MNKKSILPAKDERLNLLTICIAVFGVFFAIWTFTGKWPLVHQPYNSYILQAQSWLSGRLDLPENYSHLEIALFEGKYFISFPPFPSYVMLPFVALGFVDCDGMIALVSALLGAVYAYKILSHYGINGNRGIFICIACNHRLKLAVYSTGCMGMVYCTEYGIHPFTYGNLLCT